MIDIKDTWKQVLIIIEKNTTPVSYNSWFEQLKIHNIDEDLKAAYLTSDDDFGINIIKKRYIPMIESGFKSVTGSEYRVILKNSSEYSEVGEESSAGSTDRKEASSYLKGDVSFNTKYTFDNFVVGENNRFAHAACLAVAQSPSESYNPLFLYGNSGMGKTHLMNAMGQYIQEHNPNLKVLYVSSERFTNEMIKSIGENKMDRFKDKYRKVDVLLIDDIQFLEGKSQTQEEFFHTFNSLYDYNKQIVISSDRAPNKLVNLEERLRSRFMWNMIADLQPAGYETRVAILRKKAENAEIGIDDDLLEVIQLIAEYNKENIRELEGSFNRIANYSKLLNAKIDKAFAAKVLKEMIVDKQTELTPDRIKSVVCKYYHIKVSDIEGTKRSNGIAFPRQIAMFLCRELTDFSFPMIGNEFGGRHYTTVMHAYDKIKSEMQADLSVKAVVDEIKALLENSQ